MPQFPDLPIVPHLAEIATALERVPFVFVSSPPGSGKSTVVPLALLDHPTFGAGKILMLQPRRLAARGIAARMAEQLGEPLGERIGYRIRFESKVSPRTRIEVLTEGLLTRRLQQDPALEGVSVVILDEFHERSLPADLGLGMLRDSIATIRPDLKVLVMSATLETDDLRRYLTPHENLAFTTRTYPVEIEYRGSTTRGVMPEAAAREIAAAMTDTETGNVLVFLPGSGEIRTVHRHLERIAPAIASRVFLLYGDLPFDQQREALSSSTSRRVVLATPIAETSLTIPGVTTVIDSGLVRTPHFDYETGIEELLVERIPRDSAEQRAGRAGRLGPGRCIRMWSREEHGALPAARTPQVLQADICATLLELAAWGVRDAASWDWLTPPTTEALRSGSELLRALDALADTGEITEYGRALSRLGLHPRIAHMLLRAKEAGALDLACTIAALLEDRDILSDSKVSADIRVRTSLIEEGARGRDGIDPHRLSRARQTAKRLAERMEHAAGRSSSRGQLSDPIGVLLASAFPDRIAKRRTEGEGRYLLACGKGAMLPPGDPLLNSEFLVVADLRLQSGDSRITLAAPIAQSAFERELASLVTRARRVEWDSGKERIVTDEEERIGALVLRRRPLSGLDQSDMCALWEEVLRTDAGWRLVQWDEHATSLVNRVELVRRAMPDAGLPDCSPEALRREIDTWLVPFLGAVRTKVELNKVDLARLIENRVGRTGLKLLSENAPVSIVLPGGRERRFTYEAGPHPVLEATVQELFGWQDTPKLGSGRIRLMLHILSPARRPLQTTSDLRGFWTGSYAAVRKEMRGRYPKHPWPENPLDEKAMVRKRRPG